jgi:CheY-like chemotaxis protein
MAGYDGIEVIRQIRAIYDTYNIDSCIVGASIKYEDFEKAFSKIPPDKNH